jgi:hypothetical protein
MTPNQLKTEALSLGAGDVLASRFADVAMELHETKVAELLADIQRLTTERDGWRKQAEDLNSQIAQHLPSLDAIQRANKRAEEAEARAKEAEEEHSKVTHEAARMVASATKDLLAEKQFRAADYASFNKQIEETKNKLEASLAARQPHCLGLHFSGETLPLSVLEGVVALFGSGALVDIDGVAFAVGDARFSSPALHTWLLSVPLEVSDE